MSVVIVCAETGWVAMANPAASDVTTKPRRVTSFSSSMLAFASLINPCLLLKVMLPPAPGGSLNLAVSENCSTSAGSIADPRSTERCLHDIFWAISATVYPSIFQRAINLSRSLPSCSSNRSHSSPTSAANAGVGPAASTSARPPGDCPRPSGKNAESVTRPPPCFWACPRRVIRRAFAKRDHDQQPPEILSIVQLGELAGCRALAETLERAQRDIFLVRGAP